MPNFSQAELSAFNEDLDRHMAKEVAADERAEWIENKANELFEAEYSPFLPENVQEVIGELCFADAALLGSYIEASNNLPSNISAKANCADFIVDLCKSYWKDSATRRATILEDEREL